jgi:type II secretory pathway pseudopilin PulG
MINNKNKGYTLVELLAVIIILVTVGTIISAILASVLRSSNKSVNTESVRRNGNYAITQMSKMITYAQKLEGVSLDGSQYYTDCVSQTPPLTQYKYLQIKSFDGGITTFACNDSKIASQSALETNYLVDPVLNAVCYFNCTQESAAAPAKIDIFLNLSVQNSTNFSEGQAEIPFETSVIIRNSGGR